MIIKGFWRRGVSFFHGIATDQLPLLGQETLFKLSESHTKEDRKLEGRFVVKNASRSGRQGGDGYKND